MKIRKAGDMTSVWDGVFSKTAQVAAPGQAAPVAQPQAAPAQGQAVNPAVPSAAAWPKMNAVVEEAKRDIGQLAKKILATYQNAQSPDARRLVESLGQGLANAQGNEQIMVALSNAYAAAEALKDQDTARQLMWARDSLLQAMKGSR